MRKRDKTVNLLQPIYLAWQHAFLMLKEKQNRKPIPYPLRAGTTVYFCDFKREIDRDEGAR